VPAMRSLTPARLGAALKASLWCAWILFSLTGCRRSGSSPSSPDGSEKPLDVASAIAGCRALEECDQECSSGRPAACVSAGRFYEYGDGVAKDPARAFRLYDRACQLGYAGGCYNAALLLESGRGIAKDVDRARELYAKVCQMGSNTACERAEALNNGGR
jgi:TPR repeat protein